MANEVDEELIIQFKPREAPEHPPLRYEQESGSSIYKKCHHGDGCYVNIGERRLTCKKCGAVLDPFEEIVRLMNGSLNLESRVKQINEHNQKLHEQEKRAVELKREKVPEKLRTMKKGEMVMVYSDDGMTRGKFVGASDDAVNLDYYGQPCVRPLKKIYDIRRVRN